MPGIFISYRRHSSASAGRLYDRLVARFGEDQVFRDVDTLQPGTDFVSEITSRIGESTVLIAIIGREWLNARDESGTRRLDDPQDLVRVEITEAIRQRKVVVPVLVEGISLPPANELPDDIAAITRRNAIEISESRFDYDVSRLLDAIEKNGVESKSFQSISKRLLIGLAVSALIIVSAIFILDRFDFIGKRTALEPTNQIGTASAENPNVVVIRDGDVMSHRQINAGLRADGSRRLDPQFRIDVVWNERTTQPLRELYQLQNLCNIAPTRCASLSSDCDGFESICPLFSQYCVEQTANRAALEQQILALDEEPEMFCSDNIDICANNAAMCRQAPPLPPIPNSIFGYWPAWIVADQEFETGDSWSTSARSSSYVELHRRPSGIYALAGFVDNDFARALVDPSRTETTTVLVYGAPYEKALNPVSIPFPRIESFQTGGKWNPNEPESIELTVW